MGCTSLYIIPKKNESVRIISDFKELNPRIKRKSYPLPKISDVMLKLERSQILNLLV